jgi:hypothetical protein
VLLEPEELRAAAHGNVRVAVARQHDHLALGLVSDRLVEEIAEVVPLWVEGGRAAREVGDRHGRAEEHPSGRRGDQVEDVAPVPVKAPHGIDQVGGLEAL